MRKIILVLLLLSACQWLPQTNQPIEIPELYTGTEGLNIQMLPHADRVYTGQVFDILYTVTNKGAYNIDKAYTKVVPERSYITYESSEEYAADGTPITDMYFPIKGKTRENPYGDQIRAHYRYKAKVLPAQMQSYLAQILISACYPYKTIARPQVCIDPDVMNINTEKPCVPSIETYGRGQGAPVAITSVQTTMMPYGTGAEPIFTIQVQNVGGGQVLAPGMTTNCATGEKKELDEIRATVKLEGVTLNCNNKNLTGNTELTAGQATLRCTLPLEGRGGGATRSVYTMADGTYTTPLQIELAYDYMQELSTQVTIEQY